MKKRYKHLTTEERDLIAVRKAKKKTLEEIGEELGRSPATISREVRRNKSLKGIYLATAADKQSQIRRTKAHKRIRIADEFTRQYIEDRIIQDQWTPEQISGRLKLEDPEHYVCHETIYQYIYNEKPELGLYLPRKRHKRFPKSKLRKTKAPKIPNRVSIKERPSAIEERKEFGHFKADLVVSSRQGKGALLTMAERLSRYTIIAKLEEKTSSQTNLALSFALSKYDKELLKSMTYDNGTDFAGHTEVSNVYDISDYFCEPYHSWEKGGRYNELLTIKEEKKLIDEFDEKANKGGIIEVSKIHKAYEEKANKKVAKSTVYRMLDRHNWRKITPRQSHPKSSVENMEQFKKTSST